MDGDDIARALAVAETVRSITNSVVGETLRDSVAAHKRRVAIARGVRDVSEIIGCEHRNWDAGKYWCNDCGATAEELFFQPQE